MNSTKIILIAVIVLIGVAVGAYIFVFTGESTPDQSPLSSPADKLKEVLGIRPSVKDWQSYTSDKYGFTVKYPSSYTINAQSDGVAFIPEEFKNFTSGAEPPEKLKELPLMIAIPENKSYADLLAELKKESENAAYYEEKTIVIAGVEGIEAKAGPKGDKLHKLYRVMPNKNRGIAFITFAPSRSQLDSEGVAFLDAVVSTFTR